ncbi:hypothetical protein DRN74_01175 [Candidatus Micrarchaeota archaeon]|nr:MAG: hypothetical protein DRN74_01175 [Candidatus Micrarchaeota archaeon]
MHSHINILHSFRLKEELQEIYIHRAIKQFGLSLIGIFIPIYLLDIGFAIPDVLTFLLIVYFSMLVFNPIAAVIGYYIGEKHNILLSILLQVLFLSLTFSLEYINIPFVVLAVILGLAQSLYWVPLNINFAIYGHKEKRGVEIGYLVAIPQLFSIAAPSIAAAVIVYFGYPTLLSAAILIVLASAMPLFLTRDTRVPIKHKLKSLLSSDESHYYSLFIVQGANNIALMLWPVFIYLNRPDYFFVGFTSTILGLGYAFLFIILGRLRDRFGGRTFVKIGSIGSFTMWLMATVASDTTVFSLISFLLGAFTVMINLPIFAAVCNQSNKENAASNIVVRDNGLSTGRIIILLLALAIPLHVMFQTLFMIVALFNLYLLIKA